MSRKKNWAPVDSDYIFDRSIPEPNSGCWFWMNATNPKGYGVMKFNDKTVTAHRASYRIHYGVEVPSDVDVCHTCDIPCCVNPDHLFAGTRKDNMQDCIKKGRFVWKTKLFGENCPAAVLTERDVLAVRDSKLSHRVLGREYGVNKTTIQNIRNRKTWRHI